MIFGFEPFSKQTWLFFDIVFEILLGREPLFMRILSRPLLPHTTNIVREIGGSQGKVEGSQKGYGFLGAFNVFVPFAPPSPPLFKQISY